jgi:plasmid stabilization system protein ParE
MTASLRLRPEARADIREAARWYENQQPGLGDLFVSRVLALLERIAQSPQHFPYLRPPVRRALVAQFPYGVYFTHQDGRTVVLAVLHQRRDPAIWKSRL